MSVEVVKYIGDFQTNLPHETDFIEEGDNHILNLKVGYKNSFPGFNSELKYSNTELNTIREYLNGTEDSVLWGQPFPLITGQAPSTDFILGHEPSGELTLTSDILPLGSIVPSWLSSTVFNNLYKYGPTANDFHFQLCNGSQITGTSLNRALGVDPITLPNLIGKYLRQAKDEANLSKSQDGQTKISAWTLPLPVAPVINTDAGTSTNHNHSPGASTTYLGFGGTLCANGNQNDTNMIPNYGDMGRHGGTSNNVICTNSRRRSHNWYSALQNHNHTHIATDKKIDLTTAVTSGLETMPKSICLNYFIRVD